MARSTIIIACAALAILAGATAHGQERDTRLAIEVEAGHVQGSVRGEEATVVYQGDGTTDVRVRGDRVVVRGGRNERQSFDVRAEVAVAFLDARLDQPLGGRLPVRGLYARGFVRVEVSTPARGPVVFEAEELYLDFTEERAFLRRAELRLQPDAKGGSGVLDGGLVVRAAYLHVRGAAHVEAEDAQVTVCDYGEPHFAVGGRRVTANVPIPPPPPIPSAAAALGGISGALTSQVGRRSQLLSGLLLQGMSRRTQRRTAGSDAAGRLGREPRLILIEGASLFALGAEIPVSPLFGWGTDWPEPILRVGSSSRFGTFARVGARTELARLDSEDWGSLDLSGQAWVDFFERRGSGGGLGLEWRHRDRAGTPRGEGFVRAEGLRDRADEDRVGTAIPHEERYWVRAFMRERLAPTVEGWDAERPFNAWVDAELSRFSDPGYLLEYHRSVAKTEKEQETYVNLRTSWDDIAFRISSRHKVNGFQDQVERLPEARLDWIETPIVTDELFGGLYFDAALRAGNLRRNPNDAGGPSYRAGRGDFDLGLSYKNALGPLLLRSWGGARETVWSERASGQGSIDRFAGQAGWTLTLPLWSNFATPWGNLRHDLLPEVGTRHRFEVTRDPRELLFFDEEVEGLLPTDHLFLRLRTRLSTHVDRRPRKLIDLAVEVRYYLGDRGEDVAGAWTTVSVDLRVNLLPWIALRARAEQPTNGGELIDLDLRASARPWDWLLLGASYQELTGIATSRPVSWDVTWRLNESWGISVSQQYDLETERFLRHSGRVVRYFHRFALEANISHDPDQDDTSVSINLIPLLGPGDDPLGVGEGALAFYERQ